MPQRDWPVRYIYARSSQHKGVITRVSELHDPGAVRRTWQVQADYIRLPIYWNPITRSSERAFVGRGWADTNSPELAEFPFPAWGIAPTAVAHANSSSADGCEHATGWPMLAASYEATTDPLTGWKFHARGGIPLPLSLSMSPPPRALLTELRALPLRPIWTGLVINSAFYSIVWLVLVHGASAARRWRRRRCGLCAGCAYDRTGLAPDQRCPECGLAPRSTLARTGQPEYETPA